MPTTVYFPVAPLPAGGAQYREAYPYGPAAVGGAFHDGLGLDFDPDPAQVEYTRVLAATSGFIRFLPDPSVGGGAFGTMLLVPSPGAVRDIASLLARAVPYVFVYRYLDTVQTEAAAVERIRAWLPDAPEAFRNRTPEDITAAFMDGQFAIGVSGGALLGHASLVVPEAAGQGRIELQIAFFSHALVTGVPLATGTLTRLRELIDPTARTRRLDPMAFYSAASTAGGTLELAAEHAGHTLLTQTTRRTLIEIRDEYDRPDDDTVTVELEPPPAIPIPPGTNRGTRVMETVPPGGDPGIATTYTISWANHVFTALPSGDHAEARPSRVLIPPAHLQLQAIYLALTPPDGEECGSWFVANNDLLPLPRYTEGNSVTPLIDGVRVFQEYVAELSRARSSSGRIYFSAYQLQDKFTLDPIGNPDLHGTVPNVSVAVAPPSSMFGMLRSAALAGAQVRALLWDKFASHVNSDEAARIELLGAQGLDARAILDSHTLVFGVHHQKFLVVDRGSSSVAFCGGVDVVDDRLDTPHHGAQGPFHDVQAKVIGPAVQDIWRVFKARWDEHPTTRVHRNREPIPGDAPRTTSDGSVFVQVACTFPPGMSYLFAGGSSLQPLNGFLRAISRARKFIYIEDQYLFPFPGTDVTTLTDDAGVGVIAALRNALLHIDYLIIVVTNHADVVDYRRRRGFFMQALRASPGQEKVHFFYLSRGAIAPMPGEWAPLKRGDPSGQSAHKDEIYCHAKVWMVDDVIAKIGSCNQNRRGFTHDSEMDLILLDGALDDGGRRLAKQLRIDLWSEHLGLPRSHRAALEDHKLALEYWKAPPGGAHVTPYDEADTGTTGGAIIGTLAWDGEADPDGRTSTTPEPESPES